MVYKRFITKNGKKHGPYYYETYRGKDGKTHSRYLPDYKPKRAVTSRVHHAISSHRHFLVALLFLAIVAIIVAVGFLSYQANAPRDSGEPLSFSTFAKGVYGALTGLASDEGSSDSGDAGVSEPTTETSSEPSAETSGDTVSGTPTDTVSDESSAAVETPTKTSADESNAPVEETPGDKDSSEETVIAAPNDTETSEADSLPEENNSIVLEENETMVEDNSSGEDSFNASLEILNETEINATPTEPSSSSEGSGDSGGTVSNVALENTTFVNGTIVNTTSENQALNETNETVVLGNVTAHSTVKQFGAVLGQPVRWEKKVKINVEGSEKATGVKIELPERAGNVSVKKKTLQGEEDVLAYVEHAKSEDELLPQKQPDTFFGGVFNFVLGFFRGMTGNVIGEGTSEGNVSVEVLDEVTSDDELVVQYYTDAPYAVEKALDRGKEVMIIGPDEVHYEDVLAFTTLDFSLQVKRIDALRIYWEETQVYLSPQEILDTDSDGIYDYVSWVVPHLSNQTFQIIVVTQAEHLSVNRTFVSDVYDEVKAQDDVWSEVIGEGEFVRVMFEKNLTAMKDITVYPRVVSGTPSLEVYEVNGSELIANFSTLVGNDYNKVYLTNLSGIQDTFDLRVVSGTLEFDHILDPSGACSSGSCTFDNSYVLSDINLCSSYAFGDCQLVDFAAQLKWDVTELCDGSLGSVDSALLQLYIGAMSGFDNDSSVYYIDDQTWTEATASTTIDTQTEAVNTNPGWSSIITTTYTNISVLSQLQQACTNGDSNFTVRVFDLDNYFSSIQGVQDVTTLSIGDRSFMARAYITVRSTEYTTASQRPALFVTYTEGGANVAPQWSSNSTNTTIAGVPTAYRAHWTDDSALSGYIFSFTNGTSAFVNDSFVTFSGTGNWSNVTKFVNTTVGSTIQWQVWANDSDGSWNVTNAFFYTSLPGVPTHDVPHLTPHPEAFDTQNLTCTNQTTADPNGDSVTNIYNWLVNDTSVLLLNLPFDSNVSSAGDNVVRDYSGFGNNATLNTGFIPTWASSGKIGGAYDFNTTTFMNFTRDEVANLSNFTIDFWIYPRNLTGTQYIFTNYGSTIEGGSLDGYLLLYLLSGSVQFYVDDFFKVVGTTSPLPVDTWSHVAARFIGSTNMSLFVDGVYDNSYSSGVGAVALDRPILTQYALGRRVSNDEGLNGSLDNFRFWNRSLSDEQIYQLYLDSASGASSSALVRSNETLSGENWTCAVTPNDLLYDGETKQNSTFVIEGGFPTIALYSPNNTFEYSRGNVTFICNATDNSDITNVSLYTNLSGVWAFNDSIDVSGSGNTTYNASFVVEGVPKGYFSWTCVVTDGSAHTVWASENATFGHDPCTLTPISSGTTLTEGDCGYYNITADNVIFDCADYTIFGLDEDWYWGIEATNRNNVTIQNCTLERYDKSILLNNTPNSLIRDTTLFNNSQLKTSTLLVRGISFDSSDNSTLDNVNVTTLWSNSTSTASCVSGSLFAFSLDDSYNVLVKDTLFSGIYGQYYGDTDTEIGGCQGGFLDMGTGVIMVGATLDNVTFLRANMSTIQDDAIILDSDNLQINDSFFSGVSGDYIAYLSGANVTVFNTTLQDSAARGVYLATSSETYLLKNNTFSNLTLSGIYTTGAFSGTLTVVNNTFSDVASVFDGRYVEINSPHANISWNTFVDADPSFTGKGLFLGSSATDATVDHNMFTNVDGSGSYTIYVQVSNVNLTSTIVSGCDTGVYVIAKNVSFYDSTITSCSADDVYIATTPASDLAFYNTSFDKSSVNFQTNGVSSFENYYQLRSNVTDQNYDLLDVASVLVRNVSTTIVDNQNTNASGFTDWVWLREYSQTGDATYATGCTGSGASITCATPHNITATKSGYSTDTLNVTLNHTFTQNLMIHTPYIVAYVPTTDNFSIVEPNNQTFSIVYNNVTPITINWFVNDTEQASFVNNSQFIWWGNYSQEGIYAIKVNITDGTGTDEQTWLMTVNNTPSEVHLSVVYPTTNINVSKQSFFNVTLNVTCSANGADCGTINVSLDPPASWDFSEWDYRKNITVTSVGNLAQFPFYLEIPFATGMNADYGDLRFTNATCGASGGTELAYEIENYTASSALVWVRIPSLLTGSNALCLYYGNAGANSGENVSGVWDASYAGVWHLDEISGTNNDSTSYGNNMTAVLSGSSTQDAQGFIDGGVYFSGATNNRLTTTDDPALDLAGTATWSVWGQPHQFTSGVKYFLGKNAFLDYAYSLGLSTDGDFYLYASSDGTSILQNSADGSDVSDGDWVYLTVTYNKSDAQNVHFFINGTERSLVVQNDLDADLHDSGASATIGFAGATTTQIFNGTLDEVRFSNTVRSPEWINQSYQMVANQGSFVAFSNAEENGKVGLVPVNSGTPFYTNATSNPLTTISLNASDSVLVNFWVNATGIVGETYTFFAYANLTSDVSIGNITDSWNVTIQPEEISLALQLSSWLSQQVNWTLVSLPAENQSAEGNDAELYYVNISVTGGTGDLYMRANGDLQTPGADVLGLGNETFENKTGGGAWPACCSSRRQVSTAYQLVGSSLTEGDTVYLRYFLSAPASQAAGTYNNSLDFKIVANGVSP